LQNNEYKYQSRIFFVYINKQYRFRNIWLYMYNTLKYSLYEIPDSKITRNIENKSFSPGVVDRESSLIIFGLIRAGIEPSIFHTKVE
jgi:hypothetical protein